MPPVFVDTQDFPALRFAADTKVFEKISMEVWYVVVVQKGSCSNKMRLHWRWVMRCHDGNDSGDGGDGLAV